MKITLTVNVYAESEGGDMSLSGYGSSETLEAHDPQDLPTLAEALAKILSQRINQHRAKK